MTLAILLALTAGSATLSGDVKSYLVGEMAQLELLEAPVRLSAHQVSHLDGSIHTLEEKTGKVLLVNLWAKWCVPCRDEVNKRGEMVAIREGLLHWDTPEARALITALKEEGP